MPEIISGKYPGRALFFGKMNDVNQTKLALYLLGGRSQKSKERVLEHYIPIGSIDFVRTQPISAPEDPIYNYNAIVRILDFIVVSNGVHTDNIISALQTQFSSLEDQKWLKNSVSYGLKIWGAEPDSSHTARIAGAAYKDFAVLGLIRHEDRVRLFDVDMKELEPTKFVGISTYNIETPDTDKPPYYTNTDLWEIKLRSNNLVEITDEFFNLMKENKVKYDNDTEDTTLVGVAALTYDETGFDFQIRNMIDREA